MAGRKTTSNGRKVKSTRRGYDRIAIEGGSSSQSVDVPTVWVTADDGSRYEIPVDPRTGKVPDAYLFARLLDVETGDRKGRTRSVAKDIGVDAGTMHIRPAKGWTPKTLIESGWWQHPNESDIEGIDDTGAVQLTRELEAAAKSARGVGRQMVLIMPEESARRVRSILARDFTGAELRKAVRHGGIIIQEGNPGRGNAGCYASVQETGSLKTPVIVLRPGWDEETLVHEVTHHLRHVDETRSGLTRSPYKFNDKGERKPSYVYPGNEFNSCRNLEEATTVAESYARAETIVAPNGYYGYTHAHGDTPQERADHDRGIMVPKGKTAKGRRAEKRVSTGFEDTSISHLRAYEPGSNAGGYYRDRMAKGTMPKKKTRKKAATETTAAVSHNKRYTRARTRGHNSSP